MKKIVSLFFIISLTFILFGCGKGEKSGKKTKEAKLYFDYTGIAETTHIAFTKEETFDLKTVFKVGNKTSAYNEEKLGVTTYDDIFFYIYSWGSSDYIMENDDAIIDNNGIITRKRLSTVVIYAALKEEPDFTDDQKANGGMHILTLFFGNDQTFGTWEAPNDYLDSWIEDKINDGETDAKKATITFEFRSDFTYTLTITEGYWGNTSVDKKIEANTITGKLYGSSSNGAVRHDDNSNDSYSFEIGMNKYSLFYDETYTLFTGYSLISGANLRFLPKENN